MSFDANAHRDASLNAWEEAAAGWVRSQELLREFGAPVSNWMLEAVAPQPGQRVLELAAGLGETGLLAAELVAPVGGVVVSDQAEAMLAGARERAAQLGLANVEFQVINAEWIDLPVASVDAVLCRWGYMLMADPAAALGETRRVLRSGGRVGLAVWDDVSANPWAFIPAAVLMRHELLEANPSTDWRPAPFALGDGGRVRALLERAGFAEPHVESLALHRIHADFEEFWKTSLDLSSSFRDALRGIPERLVVEVREDVEAELSSEGYIQPDGTLEIPARTLVACASCCAR
jgi:SAM-dependent methyltransferase